MASMPGNAGSPEQKPRKPLAKGLNRTKLSLLLIFVAIVAASVSAYAIVPTFARTNSAAENPAALQKIDQELKSQLKIGHPTTPVTNFTQQKNNPVVKHAALVKNNAAIANPAPAFNNTGVDYSNAGANFDGVGNSYGGDVLRLSGIFPGQVFAYDGITYVWPTTTQKTGPADNYAAAGQVLPITPATGDTTLGLIGASSGGPSTGTATLTYTDSSTQQISLGFSDWTLNAGSQQPSFGNTIVTAMTTRQSSGSAQQVATYLFNAEIALQAGKTVQSITLPTKVNQGQMHIFAYGTRGNTNSNFNNNGMSDDANPTGGNFDGLGYSYSAQSLNLQPGVDYNYNGMYLPWPDVLGGSADNYIAKGQTLYNPNAPDPANTRMGFVGAATDGPSYGTATINYTDGSQQNFTLGMSDWTLNGSPAATSLSFGNHLFDDALVRNSANGQATTSTFLFYAEVRLRIGSAVESVTLPNSVNQGTMHIFSIATTAQEAPDNIGTTTDSWTKLGGMDSQQNSYSAQAIHNANSNINITADGYTPDTALINGINFSWQDSGSYYPDNYTAMGQVVPISQPANSATNASRLAFLGASTNGPTSGTATITYTDGSTTTFTLGFNDWCANNPAYTNTTVAARMSYRNTIQGQQQLTNYLYYSQVALDPTKMLQSVTLPTPAANQGQIHIFALATGTAYYNNAGISNDNTAYGNYDNVGNSYSSTALQNVGLTPGNNFSYDGASFSWTNDVTGFDNYQAAGQTISLSSSISTPKNKLIFLGSATGGLSSGSGTFTYTDSSTAAFKLSFPDWCALPANLNVPSTNIAARMTYRNTPQGKQNINNYLYYVEVNLDPTKTLSSVTLPATTDQGQIHVFAMGAATLYNNQGIANDTQASVYGSYDNSGNSYSSSQLQAAGVPLSQPLTFNGITFAWPKPGNQPDNYQAGGAAISVAPTVAITPVANATVLGFVGSSTDGSTSGTATINYTDGSTQQFTLGFTDWCASSAQFGNKVVATMGKRDTQTANNTPVWQNMTNNLYYAEVPLQAGKTVQSVTLPATVTPTQGALHIFAIGTK